MMQPPPREFDADDKKVYAAWLRKTMATYAALILFSVAVVIIQATTHMTNVAMLMADSVNQASP